MIQEFWHSISNTQAVEKLQSHFQAGLNKQEAENRLKIFGLNQLAGKKTASVFLIFLKQFKNILVIILIIASILSGILGHLVEMGAILTIVLSSAILGVFQEYRAEKSLESLQKYAVPKSLVIRAGQTEEILSTQIVPGDLLIISAGNKLNADCRLLESYNLQIEEAMLTGESVPSEKNPKVILKPETALADRQNMVFSGTTATYGRALGLVVGTGMQTELGKIAGLLAEVKGEKTPLQRNLDSLGTKLGITALVVVGFIVLLGLVRHESLSQMFLFGLSLAVAVVPEALVAVVSVSLALGAGKIAKRNALTKSLPVVETLGCTSVICTDKTGTLTKDEMTVRNVLTPTGNYVFEGAGFNPTGEIFFKKQVLRNPPDDLEQILTAGSLCSDAILVYDQAQWQIRGDATEGAIIVAGMKAKLSKESLEINFPRIEEIPFTSEKKFMATMHKFSSGNVVFVKGAVEVVVEMCDYIYEDNQRKTFDSQRKKTFLSEAENFSKHGQRVIALARNHSLTDLKQNPKNLEFLGMVAMADTLREEAKTAVSLCKLAGIRVIMITGDHPHTARAIGLELGIIEEGGRVINGPEIVGMSPAEFEICLKDSNIFARVSPEDKLRIVSVLQKQGEVVAMTGDGVNDAPALKKANIGVAMGIKGTDVSKESASITLLDDNFATIVSAVEQGRIIFGNIRKYLTYLLSAHVGEVVLIALAVLLGWPLPLTSVQILFVNLASDGPPALALSAEKGSLSVMLEKPRNPQSGIFNNRSLVYMFVSALWTTLLNIFIFLYFWQTTDNLIYAGTATFLSLIIIQLFKAYALKNERDSFFQGLFNNQWLNLSVILQLPILWAISHLPVFQKIFSTTQLSVHTWIFIGLLAFTIVPILEITKKILNKWEI